jgi:hypothetical protein
VAVAAIVSGHLAVLLILNRSADAPTPEVPPPPPDRDVAIVGFNTPPPPRPPKPRKRNDRRAQVEASTPPTALAPAPAPQAPAAPSAAPQPSKPDYGRWTVAPEAAPAPGGVAGLAGCTPLTLASLSGAAREACAKRLSELGREAPALEPTPDKRKAKDIKAWEAYHEAVLAWKRSGQMGPHPCPPQDIPTGKLYLDHCSLVNAARKVTDPRGDRPAVKVEFKLRF